MLRKWPEITFSLDKCASHSFVLVFLLKDISSPFPTNPAIRRAISNILFFYYRYTSSKKYKISTN